MSNALEALSLILVGALWGCTNPLLRQGAVDVDSTTETNNFWSDEFCSSIRSFLVKLKNIRVWLPYVINQSGSLMYYIALANSDLSLAVPICNALALVFSILASLLLGERMRRPLVTISGATLVVTGVTLCLHNASDRVDHVTDIDTDATHREL